MIVNGQSLLALAPIEDMIPEKRREHGVSYGLSQAGYDVRIKQQVSFYPGHLIHMPFDTVVVDGGAVQRGRFTLASTVEFFQMPRKLAGKVEDKSTWARQGLSLFNTRIENGWSGYLTLELVFHGNKPLHIPAGAGIAQIIFEETTDEADYGDGKYANQADEPVPARFA